MQQRYYFQLTNKKTKAERDQVANLRSHVW